MQEVVNRTVEFVKNELEKERTGHDWYHIQRVVKLAKLICNREGGNLLTVELAALLHDIGDHKAQAGDLKEGPRRATEWLKSCSVEDSMIQQIGRIISNNYATDAGCEAVSCSLESSIVHDADALDSMGAIGLARMFTYGGAVGQPIYDPNIPHFELQSLEDYHATKEISTINHFYQKMIKLKDLMKTETGKKLAQRRHMFMLDFVERFFIEWKALDTARLALPD